MRFKKIVVIGVLLGSLVSTMVHSKPNKFKVTPNRGVDLCAQVNGGLRHIYACGLYIVVNSLNLKTGRNLYQLPNVERSCPGCRNMFRLRAWRNKKMQNWYKSKGYKVKVNQKLTKLTRGDIIMVRRVFKHWVLVLSRKKGKLVIYDGNIKAKAERIFTINASTYKHLDAWTIRASR